MKKMLLTLLCCGSALAHADTCLQTEKKGPEGDSRYYDYGRCRPAPNAPNQTYDSLGTIGQQLQGMMSRGGNSNDRGYSDAEREANRRALADFAAGMDRRRGFVKWGATVELNLQENLKIANWQYQGADISAEQIQSIRSEIRSAIDSGKLLERYGSQSYDNAKDPATWMSADPAVRWKTCEVAAQLSRAYAFGDFIKPEEKNPARGYAISLAGYSQRCGGTAYWLGRIYEEGDALVPGVDKRDLGKDPKEVLTRTYDVAILNGYTPAFERMAELYRLNGPARYRGKSISFFNSDLYWTPIPRDDRMYMMKVQYSKCLEADPANLVCARGLRAIYGDPAKNFDYTNYNPERAAYMDTYVKNLESLLAKAGQPVPPMAQ